VWLLFAGIIGVAFTGGIWFSSRRGASPAGNRSGEMAPTSAVPPFPTPPIPAIEPRPRASATPATPIVRAQMPGEIDEEAPLENHRRTFRSRSGGAPDDATSGGL
jgi:hypothetical protein